MTMCSFFKQLHEKKFGIILLYGSLSGNWRSEGNFMSLSLSFSQASDMINAILEGYPKSKKEFLVSKWGYLLNT